MARSRFFHGSQVAPQVKHSSIFTCYYGPQSVTTQFIIQEAVKRRFSSSPKEISISTSPPTTATIETTENIEFSKIRDETEKLLQALKSNEDDEIQLVKLLDMSYINNILENLSKRASQDGIEAARLAESILSALERREDKVLMPDTITYNKVLHAHATSGGGREAAERAQSLLNQMIAKYNQDKDSSAQPSTRSFNICINAWAKSDESDAGQRAEDVFRQLEEFSMDNDSVKPNGRSLSGVVDAWAQTGDADRAVMILEHAIDKRRNFSKGISEGTVVMPNVILFNSAIHACANSNRGRLAAEKAQGILELLERLNETQELGVATEDGEAVDLRPNTRTFSLVLDAWAQCRNHEAALRAEEILDEMERLYKQGHDVKPNYVSFTTCITAWSRSSHKDAARRAEAVLDRMLALYEETGDVDFKPTSYSGNAVVTAWARSRDRNSPQRAQAVLDKLSRFCEADLYSYNAVLDCYAKRGDADGALNLVEQMELDFFDGKLNVRPDTVSCNSVLNAFARSRDDKSAIKAEALLGRMEELYREGPESVQPNVRSYTSVISCWDRQKANPYKGLKAYRILNRMEEQHKLGNSQALPDEKVFTKVIHACATTNYKTEKHRGNALHTALRTFEHLLHSPQCGAPTTETFEATVLAVSRLTAHYKQRTGLILDVVKLAKGAGQTSEYILGQARQFLPANVYDELFENETSTRETSPSEEQRRPSHDD